jgi:hypothetical protein
MPQIKVAVLGEHQDAGSFNPDVDQPSGGWRSKSKTDRLMASGAYRRCSARVIQKIKGAVVVAETSRPVRRVGAPFCDGRPVDYTDWYVRPSGRGGPSVLQIAPEEGSQR